MKKRKWKGIAVAITMLIAIITAFSPNFATKGNNLSNIALQNIEALAYNELTPNGWACFWEIIDDTSNDVYAIVTRCSDCHSVSATFGAGISTCWFN